MAKNENPPDVWFILMALVLMVFFILLGVHAYAIGAEEGGIFIAIVGVGLFFVLSSRELVFRPNSIVISDDGILLFLPFGRQRNLQWGDIIQIYANSGDPITVVGRMRRTGAIRERNRIIPVGLTYELALLVKEEYARRFGALPPTTRQGRRS